MRLLSLSVVKENRFYSYDWTNILEIKANPDGIVSKAVRDFPVCKANSEWICFLEIESGHNGSSVRQGYWCSSCVYYGFQDVVASVFGTSLCVVCYLNRYNFLQIITPTEMLKYCKLVIMFEHILFNIRFLLINIYYFVTLSSEQRYKYGYKYGRQYVWPKFGWPP